MNIHIGTAIGRYSEFPMWVSAFGHTRVIGMTGTGKSVLIGNYTLELIRAGYGGIVLDPHGNLAEWLLERIPRYRFEDVIYVDPLSDRPIGLSVLTGSTWSEKIRSAEIFMDTEGRIYGEGSMMANASYMTRNILFPVVMVIDKPNPLHLFKGIMEEDYREWLFSQVSQESWKMFQRKIDTVWEDRLREQNSTSSTNKVDTFISNPIIADIICRADGLDFEDAMRTGKIIIVNLNKGRIGEKSAQFLGQLFIERAYAAGQARPIGAPLYPLIIDEFHNFVGMDHVETILAELRKRNVYVLAGDQESAQIPPANWTTTIVGRVDDVSAEKLGNAIGKNPESLRDMPLFHWMIRGSSVEAYVVKGKPPLAKLGTEHPAKRAKRHTLENYGRPRQEVEDGINKFLAERPPVCDTPGGGIHGINNVRRKGQKGAGRSQAPDRRRNQRAS